VTDAHQQSSLTDVIKYLIYCCVR